ncbi:MAG: type I glyceraldehyde-3-phosphate dehydrogenase [Phycisphaerales bacterium]|nr:type I glyceraldehyde-3-phosphate dehydrogenase [Phycisphaerales bacterium]
MAIKVAINGFGRIGRLVFRGLMLRPDKFEVVAINDLSDPKSLAHLLKYDSVHGRYRGDVSVDGDRIRVDGATTRVVSEKVPTKLPWKDMKIDVAVESTGFFTNRASDKGGYGDHLTAGARKVVLSAPASDKPDLTVVMGVNDKQLGPDHKCVSNASCTTNCLAPMVKVLHDSFGLVQGLMTTVHAYTNDQRTADQIHKDPRRARAAALNIIPTTTGAAKAVGQVIPELNGKLNGLSLRVPVADGSLTDLVATLSKDVTAAEINQAMKTAAAGFLKGIMEFSDEPLVSSDIVGNAHSCVFDSLSTMTMPADRGRMVKVLGWYDNEWGYSMRTVDLIERLAAL